MVHFVSDAESVLSTTPSDPNGTTPQFACRTAIKRLGGHADLVKLDCEGAEWEFLKDVASWHSVRFVTIEYYLSSNQDHGTIKTALESLGFTLLKQSSPSEHNHGMALAERQQVATRL